ESRCSKRVLPLLVKPTIKTTLMSVSLFDTEVTFETLRFFQWNCWCAGCIPHPAHCQTYEGRIARPFGKRGHTRVGLLASLKINSALAERACIKVRCWRSDWFWRASSRVR